MTRLAILITLAALAGNAGAHDPNGCGGDSYYASETQYEIGYAEATEEALALLENNILPTSKEYWSRLRYLLALKQPLEYGVCAKNGHIAAWRDMAESLKAIEAP